MKPGLTHRKNSCWHLFFCIDALSKCCLHLNYEQSFHHRQAEFFVKIMLYSCAICLGFYLHVKHCVLVAEFRVSTIATVSYWPWRFTFEWFLLIRAPCEPLLFKTPFVENYKLELAFVSWNCKADRFISMVPLYTE